jgi:mannose-6-phosphate isomerase-like protein (cupin superfamily)
MALERGKLSNVVVVSAGSTVGIITVASSKKVYVKSIIACNPGTAFTSTAQVYFVPNSGSADVTTKIFDVDVNPGETVLIEPSYPLVIDTTGDSIRVSAGTSTVNFLITGDKEV